MLGASSKFSQTMYKITRTIYVGKDGKRKSDLQEKVVADLEEYRAMKEKKTGKTVCFYYEETDDTGRKD